MVNFEEMAEVYRKEGYNDITAEARVCQDVVLKAIAESGLDRNITVKGGVVMRSITGNIRRATQDMDLDFIRYSLEETSIRRFIQKLNCLEGITIEITGTIEELSQQEYHGKRVFIVLKDDTGHSFSSKIDLGVHKNVQIEQDEYCFDVCMDDEGASLLINSKEQIFTEKLRSLLRFGPLSTRYKDIFDLCYLIDYVDQERLKVCLRTYIFQDPQMRENNINEVRSRVKRTFQNRLYRSNVQNADKSNWLRIKASIVFQRITEFLENIN